MSEVLLLSGGLESSSLAWWRRSDRLLFVDYGQLAAAGERRAAKAIADAVGRPLDTVSVDWRSLGAGIMAGKPASGFTPSPEWWPFRNQMLITVGSAYAIQVGCSQVVHGAVADDADFRDATAEFMRLIDKVVRYQEGSIRVVAPAVKMTTVQLIRASSIPRPLLARTHSCDVGDFYCDDCPSCQTRRQFLNVLDASL